jgi:hypothetical protein
LKRQKSIGHGRLDVWGIGKGKNASKTPLLLALVVMYKVMLFIEREVLLIGVRIRKLVKSVLSVVF